jgi:hypothetical protein
MARNISSARVAFPSDTVVAKIKFSMARLHRAVLARSMIVVVVVVVVVVAIIVVVVVLVSLA